MRLLLLFALGFAGSAQASDNPAVTKTPKAAFPLSGALSWGHTLGQGTFVRNYYAMNALYAQSIGISGNFALPWKGYALSASQAWSMEFTSGGQMRNHELNYGDIGLKLAVPVPFKPFGFGLGGSVSAGIPVSKVSRFMGKLTGVAVGLGGSRQFGKKLKLSLGTGLSTSIYTERGRTVTVADGRSFIDRNGQTVVPQNQICRAEERLLSGGGEVTGCAVPGINGGVTLSTSVGLSYKVNDKLGLAVGLALINNFKDYTIGDDQFTSPYADPGVGRSDLTSGSLSLSYRYSKKVRLGMAMSSSQPALFWSSNDIVDKNGGIITAQPGSWYPNFPWWDFRTAANNYSSFSGSVSYSF